MLSKANSSQPITFPTIRLILDLKKTQQNHHHQKQNPLNISSHLSSQISLTHLFSLNKKKKKSNTANKEQIILRFEIFVLRNVIIARWTRKSRVDDKLTETPVFLLPVSKAGQLAEHLRKTSSVASN